MNDELLMNTKTQTSFRNNNSVCLPAVKNVQIILFFPFVIGHKNSGNSGAINNDNVVVALVAMFIKKTELLPLVFAKRKTKEEKEEEEGSIA